ncbi:MAG: hypothetical protein KAV87_34465 [Desulfobacteraceae bacterium]|nr:hypothetical protein [Desulfobacteraceae bacterium]
MKHEKFGEIVTNRLDVCKKVLTAKNKEYSTDDDRLHNFKLAATIQGITQAEALRWMWAKHLVSIMDIIDMMARGEIPTRELVAEKLGDNINYSLLCEAVIEDERDKDG